MKLAFKNRFFIKMLFTYCLVIFLGLGITSYYITSSMVNILVEKESMLEREAIEKVKTYSDDKFNIINSVFAGLYMKQYFNNNTSIVDSIDQNKALQANRGMKLSAISSYLRDTCATNAFMCDFFILDYHNRDVFFYSNTPSRDVSLNYDFYRTDFLGREQIDNRVTIIPNYIPEYINAASLNDFPVITFCIYLFDSNSVRFDAPIGLAVINVKADFFEAAYKDSEGFQGNIVVVDSDNYALFDSSGVYEGGVFPYHSFGADDLAGLMSNEKYVINKLRSEKMGLTFIGVADRKAIEAEANGIRLSIYNVIGICIAGTLLISLISASVFTKRIRSLVKNMRGVEGGDLSNRIVLSSNDEIGYLEQSFNAMCERLEEYIKNVYIFEIKTKTAELRALQAQINPHFLFNTLESIRVTAQLDGAVQTAKMVHILGNMLRRNMQTQGVFIDLKEEAGYVSSYIELQRLRYDNLFDVSIDIEPEALRKGVPKLILQPLVENAIQHGLSKTAAGGHIGIRGYISGGCLKLEVTDNGKGMDAQTVARITGGLDVSSDDNIALSNIHQRLEILFGEGSGLIIRSKPHEGTKVIITLPAMSKEEMEQYVQGANS